MACIHQEPARSESIPQVEAIGHVEARQRNNHRGDPGRPNEPSLDGLEDDKTVWADIAKPNRWQHDHGHHCDTADPDHDAEDMQRPSDNDTIHEASPGFSRWSSLAYSER
jgi:hypothetical protein